MTKIITVGILFGKSKNTHNYQWADKAGAPPLGRNHFEKEAPEVNKRGARYGQLPHFRCRTGRQQAIRVVGIEQLSMRDIKLSMNEIRDNPGTFSRFSHGNEMARIGDDRQFIVCDFSF